MDSRVRGESSTANRLGGTYPCEILRQAGESVVVSTPSGLRELHVEEARDL